MALLDLLTRAVRVGCVQRETTFDIGRPPFRSAGDAGECLCARNDLMARGAFAIEIWAAG